MEIIDNTFKEQGKGSAVNVARPVEVKGSTVGITTLQLRSTQLYGNQAKLPNLIRLGASLGLVLLPVEFFVTDDSRQPVESLGIIAQYFSFEGFRQVGPFEKLRDVLAKLLYGPLVRKV